MALQDKLIDALGRFATTFNSYRYIMAIKSAFITLMPVIIVGAFSVLISNMVLDPKNGLASFSSLSFLAALKPITSALNYATLNFLNIGAVFLIGIELGRINGIKSLFPGLLAVICFICVTPTTVEMMVDGQMHEVKDVLLRQFSDTRSLFLGMFIAILSVEIYCWLEGRKGLKIKMPDTVPPNVSASFSALIPAIITTTAIATFGFIFHQATGMYLYDAVYQVVQQPLERVVQSLPGILLLMFVAQLFWVIGIHGNQMIKPIREPLLLAWQGVKAEIVAAQKLKKPGNKPAALYQGFLLRLNHFRVLDPACGSGNFLYLALRALRDLEKRVHVEGQELGLPVPLAMARRPLSTLSARDAPPQNSGTRRSPNGRQSCLSHSWSPTESTT